MSTPVYPLIPFTEIDKEAREISVAWVEQYGTMGFDIQNKHKLASDIMNYHISKLAEQRDAEAIISKFNNVEWDGNGDPLYSYEQMKQAVNTALQTNTKDQQKDMLLKVQSSVIAYHEQAIEQKDAQIEGLQAELQRCYTR